MDFQKYKWYPITQNVNIKRFEIACSIKPMQTRTGLHDVLYSLGKKWNYLNKSKENIQKKTVIKVICLYNAFFLFSDEDDEKEIKSI